MNIRPKYILFAETGVKFSLNNLRGANWRQLVFNNYRLHLLDLLSKYGEARDYGDWLNEMLSRHANIYKLAGNNWENIAYKNDLVGLYLQDYKGGLGNDGQYKRYGSVALNPEDKYDFNLGISPNYNTRYNISNPPKRTSQDRLGTFKVDNLYSAITDDRRLLGREGDWDETSEDFKQWQKELNARGWETFLDKNDNYYKLRRLPIGDIDLPLDTNSRGTVENGEVVITGTQQNQTPNGQIPVGHQDNYGFDWSKFGEGLLKIFNNPNMYAVGRLAGNLINNERVYDELLKGIKPVLRQTYNTYRQVVGDEATKQAYYRRAALGQTKAALPFTSDADRLMAYMMEAKRIGDELRAQGDLADNQEIRRTSDESNQHQWANTQRATEVANANLASINQANALKHTLLALKHSAQWSSIDNFLKDIEYRKRLRQTEEQAINDEIWALTRAGEIENDKTLNELNSTLEAASKLPENQIILYGLKTVNYNAPLIKNLINQIKNRQRELRIESIKLQYNNRYNNFTLLAKSGGKVTHKKKDDLLYKSAKDVVEHFRKMSKLTSDALNRKTPKIEKLTSHPKGRTRKYLLGGLAPFTVYTPVALGGETTRTSEYDSSRSSRSSGSEKNSLALDLLKELFKSLAVEGLPSDVNGIYAALNSLMSRQKAFGTELSTEDIASMYIQLMLLINNIKYFKSLYDAASKIVNDKNANSEFAIDIYGRVAVLNRENGEVGFLKPNDIDLSKYNPLTNLNLLDLRATNPLLAYNNEIFRTVSNATSMEEIGKFLKALLPKIESSESVIEGYTKKDSNLIKEGIRELLLEAPEGDYKYSVTKKTNSVLRQKALNYLYSILPNNMRTLLDLRSNGNSKTLIEEMIGSEIIDETKYEFDAVTGKASDKNKGENDKEGSEGLKLDAAIALVTGKGYDTNIELNTGSNYAVNVKARYSEFLKHSGENMGAGITMLEASTSTLKGVLDWNKATLGGSTLNPTAYNYIILNNGEVVGVDLPTKSNDKNTPDFEMLKKLELLDEQLLIEGIENSPLNWQKINEICSKLQLPPKYDNLGNLNKLSWNRFAAFLVTTTEKALNDKKVILDMLGVADEQTRSFYENIIQDKLKDKKYSLDSGWPIFGGKEELYQGTVFIPIKSNLVAGAISSGLKISITDATDLELKQRGYDKLKISTYKKNELVL